MMQDIKSIFRNQKEYKTRFKNSTSKDRIDQLQRLEKAILSYREKLKQAIYDDFKKPFIETDLTEISPALMEVRYLKKHVRSWMQTRKVSTPLPLIGTSSFIKPEPKGNVLIIAPWNYPINLCLVPLAGALAAGNSCIVKPSELTPRTSEMIRMMISEFFDETEVAVCPGGVELVSELLTYKFDHIFFTGSPRVGKIIMNAASRFLSDITLELGGKSPVIIDKSAEIALAAKRIIWSKMMNSGQTCIAPDYVLVHAIHKNTIITQLKITLHEMYGSTPSNSPDLGRIINSSHYSRLLNILNELNRNGVEMVTVGKHLEEECYLAPTLITGEIENGNLIEEEIFGPLLPVIFFTELSQAIKMVNDNEKPLALYIYSKNRKNIDKIINETSSGGVVVNHGLIQFSNYHLPFGGINNSGLGKYHGKYSFTTFSHEKSILKQWLPISASSIFSAPFSGMAKRMINFMVRWL